MFHINRNPNSKEYQVNFVSKGKSVGDGMDYNSIQGAYGHVRAYMRHFGREVVIIQNDIHEKSLLFKLYIKGKPELAGGKPAKKYIPNYKK